MRFATEAACAAHLQRARWPEGFACPACGRLDFSYLKSRRLFQCCACRRQASLTAGTIFHRSRLPLTKWFSAIYLLGQGKGHSVLGLSRQLRVSYPTTSLMSRKIHQTMANAEFRAARDRFHYLIVSAPSKSGQRRSHPFSTTEANSTSERNHNPSSASKEPARVMAKNAAEERRMMDDGSGNVASSGNGHCSQDTGLTLVDAASSALLHAVERHRLVFLFWATAKRRNPAAIASRTGIYETVSNDIADWVEILNDADAEGEFLFSYRYRIDRLANDAYSLFGPGEGVAPSRVAEDGSSVSLAGGSPPYWTIGQESVSFLEATSDGILAACTACAQADASGCLHELVRRAVAAARDAGHPRWTPCIIIPWRYLETLDHLIRDIKHSPVMRRLRDADQIAAPAVHDPPELEVAEAEETTDASLGKRIAPPDSVTEVRTQALHVDLERFSVQSGTLSCFFSKRQGKLLDLLDQLVKKRSGSVTFDELREKDNVWDGYQVEDSTIRSAITRLRKHLVTNGLAAIAEAIVTRTFRGRPCVQFDLESGN